MFPESWCHLHRLTFFLAFVIILSFFLDSCHHLILCCSHSLRHITCHSFPRFFLSLASPPFIILFPHSLRHLYILPLGDLFLPSIRSGGQAQGSGEKIRRSGLSTVTPLVSVLIESPVACHLSRHACLSFSLPGILGSYFLCFLFNPFFFNLFVS